MYCEIVSIGTEILMGEITDTNSGYLASQLPGLGIELREVSIVGDDLDSLSNVIERAWRRSELTLTTGGLGPTSDDLTREAIARVLGEELAISDRLLEEMEAIFKSRGMPMPAHNLKQATLIASAQSIPNTTGTAPGWWVEKMDHSIVAMPGPPEEMKLMWHSEVSPRLHRMNRDLVIATRTVKTFGLSEAAVNEMIAHLFESTNPILGIYARPDGIFLRAIAKARSEPEAETLLASMEEELLQILGPYVWGKDDETPEERLGVILRERKQTLATMESFTGGILASTITEVPNSSDYFKGGIVAYSNEVKVAYGVDPQLIERYGAVSPQVAESMAQAACRDMKANVGIGTTGVAGPSELEGHPPGTGFIGLAYGGRSKTIQGRYPPNRPLVKRRGATHALLELIRMLEATE